MDPLIYWFFIIVLLGVSALAWIVARRNSLEKCARLLEQDTQRRSQQQNNDKLIVWLGELTLRNREAKLMSEMMDWLHSCVTMEEAYDIVSRFARQLFPGQFGALFQVDRHKESLSVACSWGNAPVVDDVLIPRDCWALRRGQLHSYTNPQTDMICRHVRSLNTNYPYVCIPLMEQGEALGVLFLQSSLREEPFMEDLPEECRDSGRQLAISMAERIGLALANMKLRETLRYQAIRDPLTNLFNRRHMEESLVRELHRMQRKGLNMGILMLDLDFFKEYNDTYGHEAGDLLLRALGNLFQCNIRREDVACRYGGEEFVIILVESSLKDSLHRAEDIRQKVKLLDTHQGVKGPAGLSIGVASFPEHGTDMPTLLRAADKALYQAKSTGRDRVCIAESSKEGDRLEPFSSGSVSATPENSR